MLTFDEIWQATVRGRRSLALPGQQTLVDFEGSASDLVPQRTELLIARRGALQLDATLPNLRLFVGIDVSLGGRLDESMPALESLMLDAALPPAPDLAGPPVSLRGAFVWPAHLRALQGCALERLRVRPFGYVDPLDVSFPDLKWLSIAPSGGVSAMLRPQEELEVLDLELEGATVGRLSLLGSKPKLRRCLLWSSGLKALDGVEEWRELRELRLQMTGISSLDPLAASTVEELTLVPRRWLDLAPLARAERLRVLSLNVDGHVSSLGDWASASALESVVLREVVLDEHGLDGLARAPKLGHVLGAPENEAALIRLARLRPDVEVEVFDQHSWDGERNPHRNRSIYRNEFGWQFTQNLALLFDCPTNYDALDKLTAALDPATRDAVEFDPENAGVSVIAEKLSDIRAVAREIEILAGPR